jgi:lysyl-tRNA synthetase, class II
LPQASPRADSAIEFIGFLAYTHPFSFNLRRLYAEEAFVEEELIQQRRAKWDKWEDAFGDRLPERFAVDKDISRIVEQYGPASKESLEENRVSLKTAGRMVSFRRMGKLSFSHISEGKGKIQLLLEKGILGEEFYEKLSLLDIGDLLGIEGYLLKTRTGELSIAVEKYTPLSKCLRPLPEKWHGLQDIEQIYRQRYLDLIINEESRNRFLKRIRLIETIRSFMAGRGFLEVETPMLHPIAGGAAARPFATHHNALDIDLYLRIAPELYLKRLVVGGFNKVFEINRNFRNEGIDTRHNPEFTMMEFYEAFSSMDDLVRLTEDMLLDAAMKVLGAPEAVFGEETISFAPPYPRISLREEAKKVLAGKGISEEDWKDAGKRANLIQSLDLSREKARSADRFLVEVFDTFVAPKLISPTFVTDFPLEVSPLSRKKNADTVSRFELYIAGMEIANGFSELNDPDDQKRRFEEQAQEKSKGDAEAMGYDEDYCQALEYGLPPTAGEGIGIDRVAMLMTNTDSIRDVLLFPLLRPRSGE